MQFRLMGPFSANFSERLIKKQKSPNVTTSCTRTQPVSHNDNNSNISM